jgi:hypothetical protein
VSREIDFYGMLIYSYFPQSYFSSFVLFIFFLIFHILIFHFSEHLFVFLILVFILSFLSTIPSSVFTHSCAFMIRQKKKLTWDDTVKFIHRSQLTVPSFFHLYNYSLNKWYSLIFTARINQIKLCEMLCGL